MADPNRELFESVVRLLAPVLDELVFVGGCTTGIFVTDPAAGGIRPTKDVDAIVDVTSYAQYVALSDRLRNLGLAEDNSEGAPLCRWRQGNVIVDVMPTDASVLGFSNRWYPMAIDTAQHLDIAGHRVRIVTPARSLRRSSRHFMVAVATTSSQVMISRTSSPSWTAVRRVRQPLSLLRVAERNFKFKDQACLCGCIVSHGAANLHQIRPQMQSEVRD